MKTNDDDKFSNELKPLNLGNEAREIRINTGTLGHRLMECRFIIELLRQFNVITVEEIHSIEAMLVSPDLENLTVAESILENIRINLGAGKVAPEIKHKIKKRI